MANKITKVEMFTMIMALDSVKANADMVDFIQHEIDLLNKKASNKKATKTQEANVGIMATIKSALALADKPVTITELQALDSTLADLSNQKVSALVRKMVESGEVVKTTDKKKSTFALAEIE